MNEELKKALEALIEETIVEIDEMKKSRFAASEIKIEGPGDGIDGKPVNGKIEKEEDEKEDEDEDKDMDKAEGKNKEADSGSVHKEEDCAEKSEGKNKEADAGSVHKAEDKKEDKKEEKKDKDAKGGEDHEKEERKAIGKLANLAGMDKAEADMGYMKGAIKKSQDEMSDLMKSYIDEKVLPLESKLTSLLELVNKIADQPVAPKGATARFQALTKSADAEEKTLSKSEISAKLFDLKKSGTAVESLDVTKAELGQDLQAIVKKYNLA